MKINRISVISFWLAFANSIAASDNVTITGNVSAIPDSTEVILFFDEGRVGRAISTDTVINGKFCLSATVDSGLTKASLQLSKDDQWSLGRILYLRPDAKIEINASDPLVQTWNVKSVVPEQNEYDRFINEARIFLTCSKRIMTSHALY